ncbi:hypothetical protein GYMLUDRAFT_75235 [Collybiopsis luxurians FD-317 M1]|uniref:Uncharacterized protein n=1 Tax=Collybiopsis luxurians FD-317 M1 TaxID=944289 RepID=A0A0D0CR19_9AGAR|nr:hypothetical protein GYMLUDRAFT_75235 [Collybiopsis luxurians FD-317 M1]
MRWKKEFNPAVQALADASNFAINGSNFSVVGGNVYSFSNDMKGSVDGAWNREEFIRNLKQYLQSGGSKDDGGEFLDLFSMYQKERQENFFIRSQGQWQNTRVQSSNNNGHNQDKGGTSTLHDNHEQRYTQGVSVCQATDPQSTRESHTSQIRPEITEKPSELTVKTKRSRSRRARKSKHKRLLEVQLQEPVGITSSKSSDSDRSAAISSLQSSKDVLCALELQNGPVDEAHSPISRNERKVDELADSEPLKPQNDLLPMTKGQVLEERFKVDDAAASSCTTQHQVEETHEFKNITGNSRILPRCLILAVMFIDSCFFRRADSSCEFIQLDLERPVPSSVSPSGCGMKGYRLPAEKSVEIKPPDSSSLSSSPDSKINGGAFNTADRDVHTSTTHSKCINTTFNNCVFPDRDSIPNAASANTGSLSNPPGAPRNNCICYRKRRRWQITRFAHMIYYHHFPPVLYPGSQWIPNYLIPPFTPWYHGDPWYR